MNPPSLLIAIDLGDARLSALVAQTGGSDGPFPRHGFSELAIPAGATPQSLAEALCLILAAHMKPLRASVHEVRLCFSARPGGDHAEAFHFGRAVVSDEGADFIWSYADGTSWEPASVPLDASGTGDFAAQFIRRLGELLRPGKISVWPVVLAMGLGATTGVERQAGVLAVEVRRACTDYLYFEKGRVVYHGTLPEGTQAFTDALATELRLRVPDAETLAARWGQMVPGGAGKPSGLWQFGDYRIGDRWVPCAALETILRRVAGDAVARLWRQIEAGTPEVAKPSQVVIVGGGVYRNVIGQAAVSTPTASVRCVEPADCGSRLLGGGASTLLGLVAGLAADAR